VSSILLGGCPVRETGNSRLRSQGAEGDISTSLSVTGPSCSRKSSGRPSPLILTCGWEGADHMLPGHDLGIPFTTIARKHESVVSNAYF